VMCLTLRMMPSRVVVVLRDVKHSTSAGEAVVRTLMVWRCGGNNTHDLPIEVEFQG